jgi:hypothetical protein
MNDDDVLSDLSPEQLRSLQGFRDIAQTDDISRAVVVLDRNSWDIQASIDDFFRNSDLGGDAGDTRAAPRSQQAAPGARRANSPPPTRAPAGPASGAATYFQWLFQSIPTALNPDDDCATFKSDYERSYGLEHPTFFQGAYTKAVAHAYQNSKFLLVYLHSPLHGDTPEFCRLVCASLNYLRYKTIYKCACFDM